MSLLSDQLNTTVHGTMKTTPYELVFGQPPRQNVFPGVSGTNIMEEDIEDIFIEDKTEENTDDKSENDKLVNKEKPDDKMEEKPEKTEKKECEDKTEKEPLATMSKHLNVRQEADKLYVRNAERMQQKYCKAKRKKVLTFCQGDYVSIRIPRIDRTSTDLHRLPCIVVERHGSQFHLYRLRYVQNRVIMEGETL